MIDDLIKEAMAMEIPVDVPGVGPGDIQVIKVDKPGLKAKSIKVEAGSDEPVVEVVSEPDISEVEEIPTEQVMADAIALEKKLKDQLGTTDAETLEDAVASDVAEPEEVVDAVEEAVDNHVSETPEEELAEAITGEEDHDEVVNPEMAAHNAVMAMADELGVSPTDLIQQIETDQPLEGLLAELPQVAEDPEDMEILQQFMMLPPEVQAYIMAHLEDLD